MIGNKMKSGSMAAALPTAMTDRPEVARLHAYLESRVQELHADGDKDGDARAARDVIVGAFALACAVVTELHAGVR
jgi:hypothetical protein